MDRRIHRVGVIFGYDGELKLHTPFEFMVAVSTCIDVVRRSISVAEGHSCGHGDSLKGRCGPRCHAGGVEANVVSKRFARVLSKGNVESAATNKRRGEEQSHRHISGFRH